MTQQVALFRNPRERATGADDSTMTSNHTHTGRRRAQFAGACGLLAFITFNLGWIAADTSQPRTFSPMHDDISDLGALTAKSPWLYNQLGANLSGLLLVVLGIGIWRALPHRHRGVLGLLAAAAVVTGGVGTFLDGLFRLDCRGIDNACSNDSWHSHAHKIESGVTVGAIFVSLVILPLVLRRLGGTRWRPMAAALPAVLAANVVFSVLGDGAATRAGTVVVFASLAYAGLELTAFSRGRIGPPGTSP